MTKPIEERKYLALLKLIGWKLEKSGFDYNLNDENSNYICTIKIIHGKGIKREVASYSVRKTENECKKRGLKWPPKKK